MALDSALSKTVELRRHTANEGDVLTPEGIEAAVTIGRTLRGDYDLLISSGAQRATQTLGCFLAGSGARVDSGVRVDDRFRSEVEDKWFEAYKKAGAGDLESFKKADPKLVDSEARRFAEALKDVFASLPEGGRALVVGHSPMNEVAVYGLTGKIIAPLSKGSGVLVVSKDDSYSVEELT